MINKKLATISQIGFAKPAVAGTSASPQPTKTPAMTAVICHDKCSLCPNPHPNMWLLYQIFGSPKMTTMSELDLMPFGNSVLTWTPYFLARAVAVPDLLEFNKYTA